VDVADDRLLGRGCGDGGDGGADCVAGPPRLPAPQDRDRVSDVRPVTQEASQRVFVSGLGADLLRLRGARRMTARLGLLAVLGALIAASSLTLGRPPESPPPPAAQPAPDMSLLFPAAGAGADQGVVCLPFMNRFRISPCPMVLV
jgi:hypothetical protein